MSREERKLRKHLEAHASRELKKELQRQRKLRLSEWHGRPGLRSDEEAIDEIPPRRKRPQKQPLPKESVAGLVVETGAGFCEVMCSNQRIRCRSDLEAAIGDQVLVAREKHRVLSVLPRRTALSRPDPHNPKIQRVIAANIDLVVNVVSLRNPPLRPGLIDRYLIAIEKSGAEPLICVNKIDLLQSRAESQALDPYSQMGIPVVLCSATTGTGLDQLYAALRDKVCVFSGHSGVGKSSLLNALDPQLGRAIGEVSEANHTGRHTTISSSLHRLANGAAIIDTPGIREFGLWDVQPGEVHRYFRDVARYSEQCAFSDCTHSHEPDCEVKRAVEDGRIGSTRYSAYRRIMDSLA